MLVGFSLSSICQKHKDIIFRMLKLWVKPLVPAIPFFSRVQEHSISLEWLMVLDPDSMPTRRWKSLPLILLQLSHALAFPHCKRQVIAHQHH